MSAPQTPPRERQSSFISPAEKAPNSVTKEKHNASPPQGSSPSRV